MDTAFSTNLQTPTAVQLMPIQPATQADVDGWLDIPLPKYQVEKWTAETAAQIYDQLEQKNWAPWLAASPESLIGRADVFKDGQILVKEGDKIVATISMNRINLPNGLEELPTWDAVAGDPTDYSQTYDPEGDTLVLMSANVAPDEQGKGLGTVLIQEAVKAAQNMSGVDRVISSFRPTGYGKHKTDHPGHYLPFGEYCYTTKPVNELKPAELALNLDAWGGSLPIDKWLGILAKKGMVPLQVDEHAMTAKVSMAEFEYLKQSYHPERWTEESPDCWQCGEVGKWFPSEDGQSMIYQESNLWGLVWKKEEIQ